MWFGHTHLHDTINIVKAVSTNLNIWIFILCPVLYLQGGYYVWVRLPDDVNTTDLSAWLWHEHNVRVLEGEKYELLRRYVMETRAFILHIKMYFKMCW